MKVLVITYYWPPAGGSGVQRWLKFAKYLSDFGIEPIIYTVDGANYPKFDYSLEEEVPKDIKVLKQPIVEPINLFFGKKKKIKTGVSNAVNNPFLSFVRGNFFIPDPKNSWIKPSVTFLNSLLKNEKVDVIISTGPPHSMHLIAQKVAKQNRLKWLADFRDPWSNLYYNQELKQLPFAVNKNRQLEESVLQQADCVLTVSKHLQQQFAKTAKRVEVITNGFDEEIGNHQPELDDKFSISYIGLLPKQSNPKVLFTVLKELCDENQGFVKDLQLNFIGDISVDVHQEIEKHQLKKNTNFKEYVPHKQAIDCQKKSQVLLLLLPNVKDSKGIITGKFFEYLTAKRPILAIGNEEGDLADLLQQTNAGSITNYDNKIKLKQTILNLYAAYKNGNLKVDVKNVERFHRKQLTEQLANLLKSL